MKGTTLAAATALALIGAMPAQAATYLFDFGTFGTGQFTTSDTAAAAGKFAITSISGTSYGSAIETLVANPSSPNAASRNYGAGTYDYDNLYLPGATFGFNTNGVLFTTSTRYVNIYAENGSYRVATNVFFVYPVTNQAITGTITLVPAVVTTVPEPAAWGLMLLGFGLVGAGIRARRYGATVTYA